MKRKGFRFIVTGDAITGGSFLNDYAWNITELAFDYLDAPPVVVGSRNWIVPAYEPENEFFPQASWILDAIDQKILPLKGHQSVQNYNEMEQIRRAKAGV